MKCYEIEVGCFVTIQVGNSYIIEADSEEEAKNTAKLALMNTINDNYSWADYDEADFNFGYIREV